MYAISFDDKNFKAYQSKLDTLGQIIHALDTIPAQQNTKVQKKEIAILDQSLSMQYLALKKQIDDLIIFADQNFAKNNNNLRTVQRDRIVSSDSVINRILSDTLARLDSDADTIVKKKQNLFKRIFNAKNDTVLNTNNTAVLNVNQIDIVQKYIENLIRTNEASYISNIKDLRRVYLLSKEKERKIITSNYELINELKKSIEAIREIEFLKFRTAEKDDYVLYKFNTQKFRSYAIMALCVILLMLMFIIYYQYVVSKYENKLIKEKDYASQLAEEKTSLLTNISHEIRTPLNSLKGVMKLLTSNKAEEIDDKLLSNINYDINLINNTVNDILNLSKIESGAVDVVLDEVYISKIINDTFSLHKYQAEQKGLTFINENQLDPILKIKSNEFRLRQVISNLINNALKYTNKGSIKLESKIVNDKISIDIVDTGIGIDDKKIDQVFRKYYTVDGEKNKVGFGLGLHISQILAKQINGKLSVKSKLGKGSTFTLQVPMNKSVANKKPTIQSRVTKEIPVDTSIVFIDDNKINLLLAKQAFSNFKNIQFFEDAEHALSYIEKTKPDIVITDVIMPTLSGWNVLESIKSKKDLQQTKVFANSAESSFADNKHSNFQFDGILEKGFDPDNLAKIYYN
ncbi:ATP-binding response regulator [Sphingobacterium litopenaei]|uniref:histidine kinase n=1 Tax=Sphingobacterium litopenaei TaxID=2763500 RepID=A0ABR7YDR0_9SPHI|nr:ATP-binding protein [Sphingobacterium litopenaei]MBD1429358.1 response regulator [Sphingobacterium litopenaei]